jgi:hypothetical protein
MALRRSLAIAFCALGLAFGVARTVQAHHETEHLVMTIDQLPRPVRTAIEQKAKGGSVPLIEKFSIEGKTVFRAHITKDGRTTDLDLDEKGNPVEDSE